MKNKKLPDLFSDVSVVTVNYGKLLENQLKRWEGGSQHIRGIAEYISNADDSYRRKRKFKNQEILVEINSRLGRKIDSLKITDFAEGMSLDDLENKFFQYFESKSGYNEGYEVTGRFGTGGKAYAIMNFENCWITSTKNGLENKAWFKWDSFRKEIVKGYNKGGYRNTLTKNPNGTTVELLKCKLNRIELVNFVVSLNSLARIRHVIKSQKVTVSLNQRGNKSDLLLEYEERKNPTRTWNYELPATLKNSDESENLFTIRYFEKPIGDHSFIDISDGISTVADLEVRKIDSRPFSQYINGNIIIRKLQNSTSVKENRKGLEEGDDLTIEIESFLKESLVKVINEIQENQREKERERSIQVSNEKITELNKFLNKCDLNFRLELSNKFKSNPDSTDQFPVDGEDDNPDFKKGNGVKGIWGKGIAGTGKGKGGKGNFNEDDEGKETADLKNKNVTNAERVQKKKGLIVMMTDDENSPVSPSEYSIHEDPVIDRFLFSEGIILININNPIISKSRERKEQQYIFNERIANFVLLIVSQYYTQKLLENQAEEERDDWMLVSRKKFFDLQRDLREDKEITYFDSESKTITN